jgi:HSP20 family molecular chaperone IbpA
MTDQTLELEEQEVETTSENEKPRHMRRHTPRVDIYEVDNSVFMTADMPGVADDGVEITMEKNLLTIRGQVEVGLPEGYELNYREYRIGDYERTFSLSDEIDRDHIEATMKNGVLHLTLPKNEEAKARKIEVRTG